MSNQDMEFVMIDQTNQTFKYKATDEATGRTVVLEHKAESWWHFDQLLKTWNNRMSGRMTYQIVL